MAANGMRDIIAHIGESFWRSPGIGHPGKADVIDYVLSRAPSTGGSDHGPSPKRGRHAGATGQGAERAMTKLQQPCRKTLMQFVAESSVCPTWENPLFNALTRGRSPRKIIFLYMIPTSRRAVPDPRSRRSRHRETQRKICRPRVEFVDIAAWWRGSKGEGSQQFLRNREVDASTHVVRCFENDDIIHSRAPSTRPRTSRSSYGACRRDLDSMTGRSEGGEGQTRQGGDWRARSWPGAQSTSMRRGVRTMAWMPTKRRSSRYHLLTTTVYWPTSMRADSPQPAARPRRELARPKAPSWCRYAPPSRRRSRSSTRRTARILRVKLE